MKIIPAINEIEITAVTKKLALLEGVCDWAQIDIADGFFVEKKTNFNAQDLSPIKTTLNLEIHLMVDNPEEEIERWLKIPTVQRAIIHLEAISDWQKIAFTKTKTDKEIGIAIDLETEKEKIIPFLERTNFFLFLGVSPGSSGQKFQIEVLDKISWLKELLPRSVISLDGGINLETTQMIKTAGVDIVYSSSFIFNSSDIGEAIRQLEL